MTNLKIRTEPLVEGVIPCKEHYDEIEWIKPPKGLEPPPFPEDMTKLEYVEMYIQTNYGLDTYVDSEGYRRCEKCHTYICDDGLCPGCIEKANEREI